MACIDDAVAVPVTPRSCGPKGRAVDCEAAAVDPQGRLDEVFAVRRGSGGRCDVGVPHLREKRVGARLGLEAREAVLVREAVQAVTENRCGGLTPQGIPAVK